MVSGETFLESRNLNIFWEGGVLNLTEKPSENTRR